MATYKSTRVTANAPARFVPGLNCVSGSVEVTTALAVADVLELDTIPSGCVFHFGVYSATEMDSDASPTLTFKIGDATDDDRFGIGVTVGQTNAGYEFVSRQPGHLYVFTADTLILAEVEAIATGATGTFKYSLFYSSQL